MGKQTVKCYSAKATERSYQYTSNKDGWKGTVLSEKSESQKGYILRFPGGPVIKTHKPNARTQVQSLVSKLRSHMPHSAAKIHTLT